MFHFTTNDLAGKAIPSHDHNHPTPRPIGPAALIGLPGEITQTLAPHTEADPAAVLIQFLGLFGNAIGRSAHFAIGGTTHFLNLFTVLVGKSSKARKGTSFAEAARLFETVDRGLWFRKRIQRGLSSGEGLIYAVRDEGRILNSSGKLVTVPGVDDKRLMVVESEFAAVLKMMRREGNVLSTQLRQAFDGAPLQTMTKGSPLAATGAHISVIGHITDDELYRNLNETEQASGFANRFLWAHVRRSKFLPMGGNLAPARLQQMQQDVETAVDVVKSFGRIELSESAKELWCQTYAQLSRDRLGLVGAMTSRAETQVLRIAALYAAMDASDRIEPAHLEAGLEVWRYCEESVEYLYGDALGDPTADQLLRELRGCPAGMTRTEVNAIWKGNKKSAEIERALQVLTAHKWAFATREGESAGRPAERWRATTAEQGRANA